MGSSASSLTLQGGSTRAVCGAAAAWPLKMKNKTGCVCLLRTQVDQPASNHLCQLHNLVAQLPLMALSLQPRGRWAGIKAFLGGWRKGPAPAEVPLPVDKLKCHLQPGGQEAVLCLMVVRGYCWFQGRPSLVATCSWEVRKLCVVWYRLDV